MANHRRAKGSPAPPYMSYPNRSFSVHVCRSRSIVGAYGHTPLPRQIGGHDPLEYACALVGAEPRLCPPSPSSITG